MVNEYPVNSHPINCDYTLELRWGEPVGTNKDVLEGKPLRGEGGVFEALDFKSLYTFLIISRRMVHLLSPREA